MSKDDNLFGNVSVWALMLTGKSMDVDPAAKEKLWQSVRVGAGGDYFLLRKMQRAFLLEKGSVEDRVRKVVSMYSLGNKLLQAAQRGDSTKVENLLSEGAPVNFQDARTGATALHYTAAFQARSAFRALLKSGECDFLLRDNKGRLAWELASDADDPAMARLLVYKTAKQAEARGLPMPPRRGPGHP